MHQIKTFLTEKRVEEITQGEVEEVVEEETVVVVQSISHV